MRFGNEALFPWTGAPCSPKRTWAEEDGRSPSNALASGKTVAMCEAPCTWSKSIRRIRFRPMYARANMGHPSKTMDLSGESSPKVAPEAARCVIVHYPGGLHPGVNDNRADKLETTLLEFRRDLFRQLCLRRHLTCL